MNCPKCGSSMVIRTAHRGSHVGQRFYGCSRYPKCREIVPLNEAESLPHSPAVIEKPKKAVRPRSKPVLGELPHHTSAQAVAPQLDPVAEKDAVGIPDQPDASGDGRSGKLFCHMTIAAYVLSGGLIAYGWATRSMPFALAGAGIYLLTLVAFLADIVYRSELYSTTKKVDIREVHGPAGIIEKILGGLIVFAGLGAFGYGGMDFDDSTRDLFTYSGMMIWIGTFVCYFLGGVTVDTVAGIPLKMGYGGWYVDRRRLNGSRRRRKRRY